MSQGYSHQSHIMDNAYSPAKFRPARETFSSVQLKYNASHICNLNFLAATFSKVERNKWN